MATWNRLLWRTALRLHAVYAAPSAESHALQLPESGWQDVQVLVRRLSLARARDWQAAAARDREFLVSELDRLSFRFRELSGRCRVEGLRPHPSVQLLYEELIAVEAEFDVLEIEEGLLKVTMEPITLEGIGLGPFAILLEMDRLPGDMPFSIVALEPNPAASCSETTHPHVNGEKLCPGEGRQAITAALKEGRLLDFFTIVDRILHTYAEGSAYVELSHWHGVPCHDCDCTTDEDERYYCQACNDPLCGDCLTSCGSCSEGYCSSCIQRCEECDGYSCGGCLSPCRRCRRRVCESCLEGTICNHCVEELEDALADEETEEATEESPTEAESAI